MQEMGIAAGIGRDRARGGGRGLACGNVDVGDDDLGALLREALGGGAADAAAAAGDEGHLASQPRHVDLLPSSLQCPVKRSPNGAQRNPGSAVPAFRSLHAGYRRMQAARYLFK